MLPLLGGGALICAPAMVSMIVKSNQIFARLEALVRSIKGFLKKIRD